MIAVFMEELRVNLKNICQTNERIQIKNIDFFFKKYIIINRK